MAGRTDKNNFAECGLTNIFALSMRVVLLVLTGLQPGRQGFKPLPSPNLRLTQALLPRVEQNQRSPPTGCGMTGPWLPLIVVAALSLQHALTAPAP
jgi:hypothetical protein